MPAEQPDLKQAAAQYDRALPAALDLLILGVGDDGHVCSLFPNHPVLEVRDTRVAAIEDSPKPPPRRLTLTMPYVVSARRVWVVALGARKLPVLQQAVSTSNDRDAARPGDRTGEVGHDLHRRNPPPPLAVVPTASLRNLPNPDP